MTPRTSIPCDVPPWVDDPSALVLVDWSSWLHRAWHVGEVSGMLAHLVGWLTSGLLAYQPAHLALVLDDSGETRRHKIAHPTDPDWRYKSDRDRKPDDFYQIGRKATEIANLHAIPCLWTPGEEADDVIATITARARSLGYRVWIASNDKDLHQLVEGEGRSLAVATWNRFQDEASAGTCGSFRTAAEVRTKWGVDPWQMADLLAIAGDSSDGIPGVEGLGFGKASALLREYKDLESALRPSPWTPEDFENSKRAIADLAKRSKKLDAPLDLAAQRIELMSRAAIERDRAKLCAQAEIARFSRDLSALNCDCDLDIPWEDLPVGGFDAEALRARYTEIGYDRKAREVVSYPKRAPWSIP